MAGVPIYYFAISRIYTPEFPNKPVRIISCLQHQMILHNPGGIETGKGMLTSWWTDHTQMPPSHHYIIVHPRRPKPYDLSY